MAGRTAATLVACPLLVAKTRIECAGAGLAVGAAAAAGGGTSARAILAAIMRQRGLAGLYSGLGPTLVSQAPYSALYYVFYTRLQVGDRWWGGGRRAGGLAHAGWLGGWGGHGALMVRSKLRQRSKRSAVGVSAAVKVV